jgi:hypothetical protein
VEHKYQTVRLIVHVVEPEYHNVQDLVVGGVVVNVNKPLIMNVYIKVY